MSTRDIRLRLTIRRHGVPEIKLVWPCACSPDTTIAKLLVQVNEVVPLESSEWGLEDYAVELSGDEGGSYECLHFQLVSQILKDEDHVVVRSLLTDDIRRRRLGGRHQISTDGKHLVDGLAFGRPWLRTPGDRPAFELPPRKRARIEHQEMAETEPDQLLLEGPPGFDETAGGRLQSISFDEGGNLNHSVDEDDEFEPDQESHQSESADSDDDADVDYSPRALVEELRLLRDEEDSGNSQFTPDEPTLEQTRMLRMAFPLLSLSKIEKEFFRQKLDLRMTYDSLRQSTAPSIGFDDLMHRMVTELLEQPEPSHTQPAAPSLFHQPRPASRPLIEEVDSDGSSTSASASASSYVGTSDPQDDENDEGSSSYDEDTGASTDESSDSDSDESSEDSSSDSDESESEPEPQENPRPTKALTKSEQTAPHAGLSRTQKRNARRKRAKLLRQQEGISTPEMEDAELLARKEALLGALSEDTPIEIAREPVLANGKATQTPDKLEESLPVSNDSSGRRARVDMGAGRRILFGALGLKNPKSKADEERIREGLMKDVKASNNPRIVQPVDNEDIKESSEDAADAHAWKSKITYRAVECCHQGMVLSEPPFPFVQRWDPQQQYGSMRKRKRDSQAYCDESYGEEGSGVFGQEADAIDTNSNSKQPESTGNRDPFGNYVNGAQEAVVAPQEASTNGNGVDDVEAEKDLPELPEDVSSLATLEKSGAKEGMVITWKQCIMSKATQWQPVMASVTAEVLACGAESSLEVRLAFRDREHREKIYDDKGQRVYDKFEVPDFEEDEEEADDGHRIIGWDDMIEPKILQGTSPQTNGEG